ncbi:MAG: heme lyase CcmF/NrfE family subunit, partial [Geminicoccales bacterium]
MPWLIGTALLHTALVVEKRDALKSWTILLSILTFGFSLLGTFLVRSGIITSVHAFAEDPARGVFILALLAIAIGGSLVLYAWRAPSLQAGGLFAPVSREGGLMLNNLLLSTACATVLLGTLYPLLLDVVGGPKISVGPPYFDATFVPLMVPLVAAVPIGAMLAWKRGDLLGVLGRLKAAFLVTLGVLAIVLALTRGAHVLAGLALALAAWVIAGSLVELASRVQLFGGPLSRSWQRAKGLPRSAFAMTLAHIGAGVFIAGVTASTAWRQEAILVMQPGESTELAGYTFTLESVEERQGPNYVAQRATFGISEDGRPVATLHPEKRFYPVERQATTEAGIDSGPLGDLYVVLGDPAQDKAADGHTVRIYYNPLVM